MTNVSIKPKQVFFEGEYYDAEEAANVINFYFGSFSRIMWALDEETVRQVNREQEDSWTTEDWLDRYLEIAPGDVYLSEPEI